MNLTLVRKQYRDDGIFGEIESGALYYFTLEHSYERIAKIPAGEYTCKRRLSPHFGYDVFELIDVPGHDFIEIHIGNYNEDTDGCILLGLGLGHTTKNGVMLTSSKQAFAGFMKMQEDIDEFKLTVVDTNPPVA